MPNSTTQHGRQVLADLEVECLGRDRRERASTRRRRARPRASGSSAATGLRKMSRSRPHDQHASSRCVTITSASAKACLLSTTMAASPVMPGGQAGAGRQPPCRLAVQRAGVADAAGPPAAGGERHARAARSRRFGEMDCCGSNCTPRTPAGLSC